MTGDADRDRLLDLEKRGELKPSWLRVTGAPDPERLLDREKWGELRSLLCQPSSLLPRR
jgi:hypothetical protein